jgi:hypothetical protein
MKKGILAAATLGASLLSLAAASADPLPPGPGRNVVVSKCSGCHATALIENERHDSDGWHETIDKMVDRGLEISDSDRNQAVAYLVRVLGPQAKPAPTPAKTPAAKPAPVKVVAKPAAKPVAKPKPKP